MRIVVIDPFTQTTYVDDLDDGPNPFKGYLGDHIRTVGRSPNGDHLLAGRDVLACESFSVADGPRICGGYGIVAGPLDEAIFRRDATSSPEHIRSATRFFRTADFHIQTTPRANARDVTRFVRKLGAERARHIPVIVESPMLKIFRSAENVEIVKERMGGRRVFGWTIWERSRLFLRAEFQAVWCSDGGELTDVTPKPNRDDRILFAPDPRYPESFGMRPPEDRWFKTFRRAEANVGPDELEKAIDGFCATCEATDALLAADPEPRPDPEPLPPLTLRKLEQHQRIFAVADEVLGDTAAGPTPTPAVRETDRPRADRAADDRRRSAEDEDEEVVVHAQAENSRRGPRSTRFCGR